MRSWKNKSNGPMLAPPATIFILRLAVATNSMQADQSTSQPFLQWFKNVGGTLNDAVGITDFPGMSRGAIAVQDIEACPLNRRERKSWLCYCFSRRTLCYLLFLAKLCYLPRRLPYVKYLGRKIGPHWVLGGNHLSSQWCGRNQKKKKAIGMDTWKIYRNTSTPWCFGAMRN